MTRLESELRRRLDFIRERNLYRELRPVDSPQSVRIRLDGWDLLSFASNDYLGLANEPALKQAAVEAIERYGAGSGASRLISGSLAPHHELEEALAAFKGTPAALSFSSGYAAALGTICALVGKDDIIILDRLVHACIVDAARLSGARLRVFAHNDLEDLEKKLRWASGESAKATAPAFRPSGSSRPVIVVVTESVFSMDGDHAPLRGLVELKEKYGAWLMVDEAHGTGLYGERRRGLAEAQGVSNTIEVQMGTLGKALGSAGGFICGSRTLIDYLVNQARSFIFSTAPVPAASAAALAGVKAVEGTLGEHRVRALWERVAQLRTALHSPAGPASAIVPFPVGDEAEALAASLRLRQQGLFVPAVRYPTVARGTARLRITLSAVHSETEVRELASKLSS